MAFGRFGCLRSPGSGLISLRWEVSRSLSDVEGWVRFGAEILAGGCRKIVVQIVVDCNSAPYMLVVQSVGYHPCGSDCTQFCAALDDVELNTHCRAAGRMDLRVCLAAYGLRCLQSRARFAVHGKEGDHGA